MSGWLVLTALALILGAGLLVVDERRSWLAEDISFARLGRGILVSLSSCWCWARIPVQAVQDHVQGSDVPLVDPDDDSLLRYVMWHHRYDPARRERRNVTLAAYDNETEHLAELRRPWPT